MKADTLTVEIIGPATETALSKARPFSEILKKELQRFVEWIDNIDVDGQQYWA